MIVPLQNNYQKFILLKNMKTTILTIAFFALSAPLFAQYALPKGNSQVNVGVGLSGWGVPIYLGFDYGVHKDISLGGELSYRSYKNNWGPLEYKHNIIGISGNGNYHFNSVLGIPKNWDFYAGLNLGFYSWSSPNAYKGPNNSGIGLGGQVGGRYYFSDKLGVNLEFGGGNAFGGGKFGLSIKL